MKKEFTQEEIEEVVRGVEECYEKILKDDLTKGFFRFRVQSYYNAFNTLKLHWLDLFDNNGKITRKDLMGGVDIMRHLHSCGVDEFGAVYFLPVDSQQLLDGEEVIKRLLYYYAGKNKMERSYLMRALLADYRDTFRVPNAGDAENVPGLPRNNS